MSATETEYIANAIRCLERSQEAKDPQRASLNVAQAAVWASLAQAARLKDIADALDWFLDDTELDPVCVCGHDGIDPSKHAEDCPIFETWRKGLDC